MYRTRLIQLREMLESIPDERINLIHWRSKYSLTDTELFTECNTTACLLGWACAYPPFKAQGLEYKHGVPCYKEHINIAAAKEFFYLTLSEAEELFCPRKGINFLLLSGETAKNYCLKQLDKLLA